MAKSEEQKSMRPQISAATLRFTNDEIKNNIGAVINRIKEWAKEKNNKKIFNNNNSSIKEETLNNHTPNSPLS